MIRFHRLAIVWAVAALLAADGTTASAAVVLRGGVVGTGGGTLAGPGYGLSCSIGQPVTGLATGDGPGLAIGFLPISDSDYSPVENVTPARWDLADNYPNPFNPRTMIRYWLPTPAQVRLGIYDLHGRLVHELVGGVEDAGEHVVIWNGDDASGSSVASGLYFARLVSSEGELTRKMMLTR